MALGHVPALGPKSVRAIVPLGAVAPPNRTVTPE